MHECGNARYILEREPEPNIVESALTLAERLLALARRSAGVACEACGGYGHRTYANTSTWGRSGISGRALTEDVCDSCWGTGRADRKGADLRKLKQLQRRAEHLEKSLQHIAEVWPEDQDIGQFAERAAENPPTAFPPTFLPEKY